MPAATNECVAGCGWPLAAIAVLVLVSSCLRSSVSAITRARSRTSSRDRWAGRCVFHRSRLHLLPWPGFEISDLSVAEDPAYGAEPVLHANKVTASIRLFALLARARRDRQDQRRRGQPQSGSRRRRAIGTSTRSSAPPPRRLHQHRAHAGLRRCPTLRPPTPASTSRTAQRSSRFRWSTPISRSGRKIPASGASACAASPRALT